MNTSGLLVTEPKRVRMYNSPSISSAKAAVKGMSKAIGERKRERKKKDGMIEGPFVYARRMWLK